MRILTYKRTHTGDPDINGVFGVNDCMGQVRDYDFDVVIGVGGIGSEPMEYGIDRKINWVGINAKKIQVTKDYSSAVTFEHFVLLEDQGPLLQSMAPNLAKRMYEKGARYLLSGYTVTEKAEAIGIINWALNTPIDTCAPRNINQFREDNGCLRRGCGTKASRKYF